MQVSSLVQKPRCDKVLVCLLFMFLALLGPVCRAEAPPPEAWRQSPPKLPPPAAFKMPEVKRFTLDNGLSVQLVEDHRVPFITVSLGIRTGGVSDPPDMRGLASMVADMLTEGTETKTSKELAEEVDFIGGGLSAGSGADFVVISGSSLSQYNDRLFAVLADVVLHPSFPENELKLKKTNLIQELVARRGKADFLAEEKFHEVVFGSHPYSVVAPKPEAVERMTRTHLKEFHSRHYLPNEAVLVVVGDFQTDKMKESIEKLFGGWRKGDAARISLPEVKNAEGRSVHLVNRPGSVQSSIRIGNVAISRKDPDFFAVTVANQVLGGAATSRLFTNLREKKGYTYGAYSGVSARRQPGHFTAHADVRTEVTGPALQEFFLELERICKEKPSEEELKESKHYLAGSFQLGLETQGGLAGRLMEGQLYELPADYLESYADNIMAVTADDVQRVAKKFIDVDSLVVTVVGDASKIKGELETVAPVCMYDTSGAPVKSDSKTADGGS